MSMLRRRMRCSGFVRPATAAVCALCAFGTGHGTMAASHDTLHDVPGYFSYMSNVEGEIRSYHAAVDGLAQAKTDLENARNNLVEARAATADATKNLVLVGQNLRAAEDHLAAVRTALSVAGRRVRHARQRRLPRSRRRRTMRRRSMRSVLRSMR